VYLQHVEDNLRIKFFSKVKVAGNVNGYRFQKLFTYYDTQETGVVRAISLNSNIYEATCTCHLLKLAKCLRPVQPGLRRRRRLGSTALQQPPP